MSIRRAAVYLGLASVLCASASTSAAETIGDELLECLPNESTIAFSAQVVPEVDASKQVRLYFRRLNPTGAYYWIRMNPGGQGNYWTVFPKPEERDQQELTDEWWEVLKDRDWAEGHDRDWLEDWLENQQFEAAEYYTAVVDVEGAEVTRTPTRLVEVRAYDDCRFGLSPFELGQSQNLTVGETTDFQRGKQVFHWLCDGIVSRVDPIGVLRADEICRSCVVAGWLPIASAAGALVAGTTIQKREPPRASDTQP